MRPTADGLAGRATTTEYTGTARQAQDRVTEPASPGGLRGGTAAVPPRAAAVPQTSPRRERAAQGMPGPETGARPPLLGQAPVRARVQAPAGGAPSVPSASPAGSRGLRGAEWQAAVKRAQRRRPGRAVPRAAANVTIPPVTGGAALTAVATCLGPCGWTAGPGDPAEVDKLAEKHTTRPPKHPTNTFSVLVETGGTA